MKKLLIGALILSGCTGGQLPPPEYIAEVIQALKKPTKTATPISTPTPTETPDTRPTVEVVATPTPTAAPSEGPALKKPCVGSLSAPDGAGGFLFKDGDSTRKVVVLLPGRYRPADTVKLTRLNGQTENLAYHGLGNPDKDGDRQHWRGSQPTGKYQGKVEVFTGQFGCVYTFKVAGRVD